MLEFEVGMSVPMIDLKEGNTFKVCPGHEAKIPNDGIPTFPPPESCPFEQKNKRPFIVSGLFQPFPLLNLSKSGE